MIASDKGNFHSCETDRGTDGKRIQIHTYMPAVLMSTCRVGSKTNMLLMTRGQLSCVVIGLQAPGSRHAVGLQVKLKLYWQIAAPLWKTLFKFSGCHPKLENNSLKAPEIMSYTF